MAEHHIVPKSTYYLIFAALMAGTGLTVAAAFIDMGVFNNVVALTIAVTKATLVVMFFMHVKYSPKLTWLVVISSVFWLFLLLFITLGDYMTRGWSLSAGG